MTGPVLGRTATGPIDADQMDVWPAPGTTEPGRVDGTALVDTVTFTGHELQAVCPVTHQPDVYTIEITYSPRWWVVESKSLKLYLTRWRDYPISCEALTATIADDLHTRLQPRTLTVRLTQNVRGGLILSARATRGTAP